MRVITKIYSDLRTFYADVSPAMGPHAYGARILYSPPTRKARVMFVGAQPGGTERKLDIKWPDSNEYADAARFLGATLRKMVDAEILRKYTVGTNVNFFRAPSDKLYRKYVGLKLRHKIQKFCLPRVFRLIDEMDPRTVFCIGFKAFKALHPINEKLEEMRHNKKGILVRTGEIAGRPVVAVPHLTGCRISRVDMNTIGERLRALLH